MRWRRRGGKGRGEKRREEEIREEKKKRNEVLSYDFGVI